MDGNIFIKRLQDIQLNYEAVLNAFILNLRSKYNISINLHDVAGVGGVNPVLEQVFLKYQYHNNHFCNFIKKNKNCFELCVINKEKLCLKCKKNSAPFYGSCYMGIEELVYPVLCDGKLLAIICVGQFCENKNKAIEKISGQAKLYNFDLTRSLQNLDKTIKPSEISIDSLIYDISFLAHFIELFFKNSLNETLSSKSTVLAQTLDNYKNNFILNNSIKFINENYDKALSLKLIASNSYCNHTYLSSLFNEKMNITITDYINKIRIEKARELIDITSKSITEISCIVGFNDSGYFTRVFKSIIGVTPKDYRQNGTQK